MKPRGVRAAFGVIGAVALLGLGACANWERHAYEGMRQGAENSARRPGPAATPKPNLPSYDRYEAERRQLRPADPAASAAGAGS